MTTARFELRYHASLHTRKFLVYSSIDSVLFVNVRELVIIKKLNNNRHGMPQVDQVQIHVECAAKRSRKGHQRKVWSRVY